MEERWGGAAVIVLHVGRPVSIAKASWSISVGSSSGGDGEKRVV